MASAESRFDVHTVKVPLKKSKLTIVPIGDIHFNAPMFAKEIFNSWCQNYKERIAKGENIWFLGIGDYLETLSISERKALVNLHESSHEWLDEQIENDVNKLAKALDFTKNRWLGMLTGNHNYITGSGKTVTQMLAEKLGSAELGVVAAIRVVLSLNKPNSTNLFDYDIWAHHGAGGGQLAGSTLNALERWANGLECDLVCMGHDHKMTPAKLERLVLVGHPPNVRVKSKTLTIVRTGGFLKGYEKGQVSYIARKALRPCHLGTAEIRVKLEYNRTGEGNVRNYNLITKVTI